MRSSANGGTAFAPALRWVVRVAVLSAFAATTILWGPRAAAVLAARFERAPQHSPLVALDRVGFLGQPDWLDQPLLLAVTRDLAPWLGDELPILDDAAGQRLVEGLRTVPWVRDANLLRVFPNRMRLQLELRRPVLGVRNAAGEPLCLVDRLGVALPWAETPLPAVWLHREGGGDQVAVTYGRPVAEPRVTAAAAIAVEWRDQIAPQVPNCPALLEVDTTNLGERWRRGRPYAEVRVKLQRQDGDGAVFAYDRPADSPWPRVPGATKAAVLRAILELHPGLAGLTGGDLRMIHRFRDYLQPGPAGAADPDGPWADLGATHAGR
ncbi:MAG: hypothetical protein JNK49_02370 [Planctomycetes bacterium]|nr:hypothetical protein [Planctomycetota bacterium]